MDFSETSNEDSCWIYDFLQWEITAYTEFYNSNNIDVERKISPYPIAMGQISLKFYNTIDNHFVNLLSDSTSNLYSFIYYLFLNQSNK